MTATFRSFAQQNFATICFQNLVNFCELRSSVSAYQELFCIVTKYLFEKRVLKKLIKAEPGACRNTRFPKIRPICMIQFDAASDPQQFVSSKSLDSNILLSAITAYCSTVEFRST